MIFDITEKMSFYEKEIYGKYCLEYPFRIVDFLNELKINVFAEDMGPNESGAIVKDEDNYSIFFNERHPSTRIRFTLAHELGHYLFDKDYLANHKTITDSSKQSDKIWLFRKNCQLDNPEMRKMDIRANQFAAELLMPQDKFIEVWYEKTSPSDVANFFNVSLDATKIRATILLGEIF